MKPTWIITIIALCLIVAAYMFGAAKEKERQQTQLPRGPMPVLPAPDGSITESVYESLRDYQIDLHMDTVWIYDGDRLVGRYISNWKNQMDSIILADNE